MITELTLSAVAVAFAINVLTSLLKRWVYPQFGPLGVQVVCFVLALIGAWFWLYGRFVPEIGSLVVSALGLFSLAVTMYEVLLSKLDFFKVKTPQVLDARETYRDA